MSQFAVEVHSLVRRFKTLVAVDRVDLKMRLGESLALLGPNGAGKTTLVETIEGLQEPDEGEIRLFGMAWRGNERVLRSKLGICLQETRLPEKATALEVLRLFASFYALPLARAGQVLDQIGLASKSQAQTQHLSGGQRQRLALGIAMLNRPQLLLLDEPTTGLDPSARQEVWALIEELKRAGCALLLTTHYMEEAEALCPGVALMNHGKLLARDSIPALLKKYGGGDVLEYSTDKPSATLAKGLPGLLDIKLNHDRRGARVRLRDASLALPLLVSRAKRKRLRLRETRVRPASLNDLFVGLTGGSLDQ